MERVDELEGSDRNMTKICKTPWVEPGSDFIQFSEQCAAGTSLTRLIILRKQKQNGKLK